MKQLRTWLRRLCGTVPNSRRERELAEEIEANLELHIADNLRSGMTPDEARRAALVKLGGIEASKEACREQSTLPFVENVVLDARFALRQLRKNPGFTCTAMLMLGAGICASVAIFTFVDAALVKPLPYRDPLRLVGVYELHGECLTCNLSYLDYLDWKKLNTVFTDLEAYQHNGFRLTTSAGTQMVTGTRVSAGFLRVLGVSPILGRDFSVGEDALNAPHTVLLTYGTWQNRYGGRQDIVGQTIVFDDVLSTVIGVLPRDFHFAPAEPAEFWIPLRPENGCEKRRSCHNLYGVARLKDGVTARLALANTQLIARQLELQFPESNRDQGANVAALTDVIAGRIRPLLLILLGGAGLLLLISCVNVANLLLVRAEARRREVAVRGALGASPARLARQFATEGFSLVVAGGGFGLVGSFWAIQLLSKLIPPDMLARMPYLLSLNLNGRVLAFAVAISLLAAVLFSIIPSLRLSRDAMLGATHGAVSCGNRTVGTSWQRLGSKLVIIELATAMALLAGAGLLAKSFYRLMHVDLAFQPNHLATLELDGPLERYGKDEQAVAWLRRTLSRVAGLPGVKSLGTTTVLPVSCNCNTAWIRFAGKPFHGEHNDVLEREVSAGYFETIRAPLIRGRFFTDRDDRTKPPVVVINQALADAYYPGEDPIGQKISFVTRGEKPMEIVGVVGNLREGGLDEPMRAAIYLPFNQSTDAYFNLVVRTAQSEDALFPMLTAAIHEIDPDVAVTREISMDDRIQTSIPACMHRSAAWLVGGFAALALVLSVIGLYGVISYSVSQRTREIGVRIALGAQRPAVYGMILREAGRLSAVGITAGIGCSLASATLIQKMLFSTPPRDFSTLASVALLLAAASLLASFVPARRAASVDPAQALRAE